MEENEKEEFGEIASSIKYHLEQAKLKMTQLSEKKILNEAVLEVLNKGMSEEEAADKFKVPCDKLHEAVSKHHERDEIKETNGNKLGELGDLVEEVGKQLERHKTGQTLRAKESGQNENKVSGAKDSNKKLIVKMGRRTKIKNVMKIRRVDPEEIEDNYLDEEEKDKEDYESLTCESESELDDPTFVLPDEDIIYVQEGEESRTSRSKQKTPKKIRSMRGRHILTKKAENYSVYQATKHEQIRNVRNFRKKQKKQLKGKKDKCVKKHIPEALRVMNTAIELVKAYNIPHPLVAKKFNIPIKALIENLTYPAETEVAQNEILERIIETQQENAMHWIPTAIKEGYVSVRSLFRYERFGAHEDIIQQCLMDMDKNVSNETSKRQWSDEVKDSEGLHQNAKTSNGSHQRKYNYTVKALPKGTQRAYCAVRDDDMPMKIASKEFNVPLKILQSIKDGKIKVQGKVKLMNPVPRKFKEDGKEFLKSMQPERSKDKILDSLEQGKIFLKDAADLYGLDVDNFRKVVYSVEEEDILKQLKNDNVLKAVDAVRMCDMKIKVAALKFKVPEKVVTYFSEGNGGKKLKSRLDTLKRKNRYEIDPTPIAKYKKRYECSVMQIASIAVKSGKIDVKSASEKYGIEESKLQDIVDGKLRINTWASPKSVPRKFLPGMREKMRHKLHPDGSKDWVLEGLEEGSLTAHEAAILFGISKTCLNKKLFNIDELRIEWTEEDMEKAIKEVKERKASFSVASNKFKVPRKILWSRVKGINTKYRDRNPQCALTTKQEEELKMWLLDLHSKGEKCSTNDIFVKAKAIRAEGGGGQYLYWDKWLYPGRSFKSWLLSFKKRHNELHILNEVRKKTRRTKKELALFRERLKQREEEEKKSASSDMPKVSGSNWETGEALTEKAGENQNSRKGQSNMEEDEQLTLKSQREESNMQDREKETGFVREQPVKNTPFFSDEKQLQAVSDLLSRSDTYHPGSEKIAASDTGKEGPVKISEMSVICTPSSSREVGEDSDILNNLSNDVMDEEINHGVNEGKTFICTPSSSREVGEDSDILNNLSNDVMDEEINHGVNEGKTFHVLDSLERSASATTHLEVNKGTFVSQAARCANCGGIYDQHSSSPDQWVCCGTTEGGCGAFFHVKCTDQCDIPTEGFQLLTWLCPACIAVQPDF